VVELFLGDLFHFLSYIVIVCVSIGFSKAGYVYVDTCHCVTDIWPFAAIFVPSQSVKVLEVYAGSV